MKTKASALAAVALTVLVAQAAKAAEMTGYNMISVTASSDALVSVPFRQDAVGTFAVSTKTGNGVTVTNTLTSGAFNSATTPVNPTAKFYVRFTSGAAKGFWSSISSNTTGAFVFANLGFLPDVVIGDTFVLYPHQTLGTIFPDGMQGKSYISSTNSGTRLTEVFVTNTSSVGINKAAGGTFFYISPTNDWRKVGGNPNLDFTPTPINPDDYIILRNRTANPLTYVVLGDVPIESQARLIPINTVKNDVAVVSGSPLRMTLGQLGLTTGTSGGNFMTSTSTGIRTDELYVYNNAQAGINKAASGTFYYFNNAWRKVGSSPAISFTDSAALDAGAAFIIRKFSSTNGTVKWTENSPFP